jgi:hypothetical protein
VDIKILLFATLANCSAIATADRSIVITERGPVRGIVAPAAPPVSWRSLCSPVGRETPLETAQRSRALVCATRCDQIR